MAQEDDEQEAEPRFGYSIHAHRDLESRMIDVTRAMAIMLVLLVHTSLMVVLPAVSPISTRLAAAMGILNLGASGVPLFFVISGYLLNMIYAPSAFAPRKYWARRFGRIYPAWVFWTAIAVVASFIPRAAIFMGGSAYGTGIAPSSLINVGYLLLHLAFLGFLVPGMWNNFIPGGWSIQAEMFNYALYPLIKRSRFWAVLVAVLGVEVVHFLILVIPIPIPSQWVGIVVTYLTSPVWFVIGISLSRFAAKAQGKSVQGNLPLEAGLVVGIVSFAIIGGLTGPFVSQATSFAVIGGALAASYGIVRMGHWRRFIPIGRYSYGIYFSHLLLIAPAAWVVGQAAKALGPTGTKLLAVPMGVVAFVVILGTSYLVARAVFELVERRPLEWARRYPTVRRVDPPVFDAIDDLPEPDPTGLATSQS